MIYGEVGSFRFGESALNQLSVISYQMLVFSSLITVYCLLFTVYCLLFTENTSQFIIHNS
jgi:hypothetical protein